MPSKALVFPGQGAHDPWMVREALRRKDRHLEWVQSLLGSGVLEEAVENSECRGRNEVASLVTAWWSLHLLSKFELESVGAVGGYSVGQFMACHAAGIWSAEDCLHIIHRRASLMNRVVEAAEPMGMVAVIGLMAEDLRDWLDKAEGNLAELEITNINAPGQLTLGGPIRSLDDFEASVSELKPRKIVRLETSGAWHHSSLDPVVEELESLLMDAPWCEPKCPILSNLDGDWLPKEKEPFCRAMAQQVAKPVCWDAGVRSLVEIGCEELVETGYGSVLSRFGFFIDRSVKHTPLMKEQAS